MKLLLLLLLTTTFTKMMMVIKPYLHLLFGARWENTSVYFILYQELWRLSTCSSFQQIFPKEDWTITLMQVLALFKRVYYSNCLHYEVRLPFKCVSLARTCSSKVFDLGNNPELSGFPERKRRLEFLFSWDLEMLAWSDFFETFCPKVVSAAGGYKKHFQFLTLEPGKTAAAVAH